MLTLYNKLVRLFEKLKLALFEIVYGGVWTLIMKLVFMSVFCCYFEYFEIFNFAAKNLRDHSFSTHVEFSEKLTFLGGKNVFRKILRTY